MISLFLSIIKSQYFLIFAASMLEIEIYILYSISKFNSDCVYSYYLLFFCCFLGTLFWSQVTFFLGKLFGQILRKKYEFIEKKILEIKKMIKKYGIILVIVFRYIWGVKLLSPFILGCINMDGKIFTYTNVFSAFLWTLIFFNICEYFGKYLITDNSFYTFFNIFLLNICVSIMFYILFFIYDHYINQ